LEQKKQNTRQSLSKDTGRSKQRELGFLAKSAAVLQSLKRGSNQQFYPMRHPNPERGILGLLNAKQRHSRERAWPEPERSRAKTSETDPVCSRGAA